MQTIIVLLNPGKLTNADMDLCYCVPDRIEEVAEGAIESNGFDFLDTKKGQPGPLMGLWLKTENASESWPIISKLFQEETFKENDLSETAQIYISENDTDCVENCILVYPI